MTNSDANPAVIGPNGGHGGDEKRAHFKFLSFEACLMICYFFLPFFHSKCSRFNFFNELSRITAKNMCYLVVKSSFNCSSYSFTTAKPITTICSNKLLWTAWAWVAWEGRSDGWKLCTRVEWLQKCYTFLCCAKHCSCRTPIPKFHFLMLPFHFEAGPQKTWNKMSSACLKSKN